MCTWIKVSTCRAAKRTSAAAILAFLLSKALESSSKTPVQHTELIGMPDTRVHMLSFTGMYKRQLLVQKTLQQSKLYLSNVTEGFPVHKQSHQETSI